MAIYLFSQILKFSKYSFKLIETLSRRHLINSSDVFVIKGFTVESRKLPDPIQETVFPILCLKFQALYLWFCYSVKGWKN